MTPDRVPRPLADRVGPAVLVTAMAIVVAETIAYRLLSGHLDAGIEFLLRFDNVPSLREYVVRHLLTNPYYPPLTFAVLLLTYLVAGMALLPHVLVGNALILGGAFLLYRMLLRRGVEPLAAGIACAAYLFLPGTVVFGRTLAIELPMMLLLPAALYLADRSDGFRDAKASAALGVVVGLGMLTKWSFAAYAIVPLAMILGSAVAGRGDDNRSRVAAVAVFALALVVIAGPWYALRFDLARMIATASNDPNYADPSFTLHLAHNLRLLAALLGTPVAAYLAISAVVVLIAFPGRFRAATWIASIVVALALFSVPAHLEDRYIYPILVFVPLLAAVPNAGDRRRSVARLLAAGFLVAAIVAHVHAYLPTPETTRGEPSAVGAGRLFWGKQRTGDVLAAVARETAARRMANATVAVHPLWTNRHVAASAMQYERRRLGLAALAVVPFAKFNYLEYAEKLRAGALDAVIVDCAVPGVCRDGPVTDIALRTQDRMDVAYVDQRTGAVQGTYVERQVREDLAYLREHYDRAADLDLGDGVRAWVYARRP
jgi:hypothetical protein